MRRVCAKCGVSELAGQGSSLQLGMEGAARLLGAGGLPCRHEVLFSDGSESGGAKGAEVERNKRGRGEGQQDHGGVEQARVEMVVGAGQEQWGEKLRDSRMDGAAPGERGSEAEEAKGGVDKAGPTAGLEGGAGADENPAMLEKGGAAVVDGSVEKMGQAAAAVVAEEGAASNGERPQKDVEEAKEGEGGLMARGDGAAVVAADEAETDAVGVVVAAEEAAAGVVAPVIEEAHDEEAQNLLGGAEEEEEAQDDLAADELLPPANLQQQQQQAEEEQHPGDLIVLPWMGDFPGVFVMSTYFSRAYPKESLRKTRADTAKNMIQAVAVSDGVLPAYLIHVCLML